MIEQRNTIIQGDALEVLKTLPDGIVQTCVTSPPYYGLRDYGTAQWTGGSPECDHTPRRGHTLDEKQASQKGSSRDKITRFCKCGATRIDQQIGLEDTPEAYIARLVEVFREVKRVLRPDGTLWCNIADSYVGGNYRGSGIENASEKQRSNTGTIDFMASKPLIPIGYKPKDLYGIPWMLAFALRADGWYLRQELIWNKPNCMPESVTDRCTKSHETIFMLSKHERYFYDAQAIAENATRPGDIQTFGGNKGRNYTPAEDDPNYRYGKEQWGRTITMGNTRNKRSVWTVSTSPFSQAHFATFPPKLIEPCILAGSRPGDIVLDPFSGAGTALMVASQLGRSWLGIELNPEYITLARERMSVLQVNLWEAVS